MEPQKKNFKIVADKKNARMILPNMLTLIGVCIGLTSIRFALDEKFELAIIAIIFAALIDGLDGRIARLIKGTSKVGKELDSLTDMISFGVAPAFIMYFWKLNTLGRFGWLLCLVYVICVALRLARFNINSNQEPSWRDNFFEGVPSPAGGILVLTPLIISLLIGTPTICLFGALAGALSLGKNSITGPALMLPLSLPVLILGTQAINYSLNGINFSSNILLLTAILVFLLPIILFASVGALKLHFN